MTNEEYFQKKFELFNKNERKEFKRFKHKYEKLCLKIQKFQDKWNSFSKNISEKYKEEFAKFDKNVVEEFERNLFNSFLKTEESKNESLNWNY